MKLPLLIPELRQQKFSCHACTECCRHLVVHLTPTDRARIDAQGWQARLADAPYVRLGGNFVLNHAPSGGCIFLQADGKCRIHAEYGAREKPLACQLYPFSLEAQGGGLRASVRFDCPTVVRSEGERLNLYKVDLERIAGELQQTAPQVFQGIDDRFFLTSARPGVEQEVAALVDCVDDWLANTNRTLDHRLIGLCSVLSTLRAADLQELNAERLIDLVKLLFAETGHADMDRLTQGLDQPTMQQTNLLLHAVFSHCEQIDLAQARRGIIASWEYRWGQLIRARKLASRTGFIPALVPGLKEVSHSKVDKIGSDLADAAGIDELMTRYLRAKTLSRSVFGGGYYGWPIVDGLCAMVLSVAVIGWLSRYLGAVSGKKSFGVDECGRAVAIVDRAAGRVPEPGSRSGRLRVRYLCGDDGLMRLIRRYPLQAIG